MVAWWPHLANTATESTKAAQQHRESREHHTTADRESISNGRAERQRDGEQKHHSKKKHTTAEDTETEETQRAETPEKAAAVTAAHQLQS